MALEQLGIFGYRQRLRCHDGALYCGVVSRVSARFSRRGTEYFPSGDQDDVEYSLGIPFQIRWGYHPPQHLGLDTGGVVSDLPTIRPPCLCHASGRGFTSSGISQRLCLKGSRGRAYFSLLHRPSAAEKPGPQQFPSVLQQDIVPDDHVNVAGLVVAHLQIRRSPLRRGESRVTRANPVCAWRCSPGSTSTGRPIFCRRGIVESQWRSEACSMMGGAWQ